MAMKWCSCTWASEGAGSADSCAARVHSRARQAGETVHVHLELTPRDLSHVSEAAIR